MNEKFNQAMEDYIVCLQEMKSKHAKNFMRMLTSRLVVFRFLWNKRVVAKIDEAVGNFLVLCK